MSPLDPPGDAVATAIADAIRRGLLECADPAKAEGMRAYLKSDLPCLGTYSGPRREVVRDALADVALDPQVWVALVRDLWDDPTCREERQAAVDVLLHRRARPFRDVATLDLFRDLAVEGAWWDLVDAIAGGVNEVLDADRAGATPVVRAWATDDDLWVRRLSIIAQLRSRDRTDLDLLAHAIDANAGSGEFFLRKAIGWALRTHARVDPDWVRGFVDERRDRLSALSVREATRHL